MTHWQPPTDEELVKLLQKEDGDILLAEMESVQPKYTVKCDSELSEGRKEKTVIWGKKAL